MENLTKMFFFVCVCVFLVVCSLAASLCRLSGCEKAEMIYVQSSHSSLYVAAIRLMGLCALSVSVRFMGVY